MNFFKSIDKIDKESVEEKEPVTIEEIENLIKIINTAHEVKCKFEVCLQLTIGDFAIDADSFESIKLLKKDKLVVKYYNALLSTETTIEAKNIIGIYGKFEYKNKTEE